MRFTHRRSFRSTAALLSVFAIVAICPPSDATPGPEVAGYDVSDETVTVRVHNPTDLDLSGVVSVEVTLGAETRSSTCQIRIPAGQTATVGIPLGQILDDVDPVGIIVEDPDPIGPVKVGLIVDDPDPVGP